MFDNEGGAGGDRLTASLASSNDTREGEKRREKEETSRSQLSLTDTVRRFLTSTTRTRLVQYHERMSTVTFARSRITTAL